ncbi:hotdog fold domain-containing protein [Lysobacter claricitrinus]|uniref:hotdog fold domain-containing protein n=1 Tax=Lysobacter claricitrinus TaxID=3367728 RepID=UPI0038B2C7F5
MNLLDLHQRMTRWPLGRWLFARAVCFKAPYFASIAPRIDALEPGRCVVSFAHRRAVTNHIGTVHAIALCNAAELAAGLATEAGLPPSMRWIPKGMQVEYVRKAMGRMTTTARIRDDIAAGSDAREAPVDVETTDPRGDVVFRAVVSMWVSPKPPREG